MNTDQEIRAAFADYQETRFGGEWWPSGNPEHGALPERFARRPDGTVKRPGYAHLPSRMVSR